LDGAGAPVAFVADGKEIRVGAQAPGRSRAGGTTLPAPGVSTLLALDWNRDYRMDLALAGSGGLRLLLQRGDGTFADATVDAAKGSTMITAACDGVWTADVEMDGDLDLVVGIHGAAPVVLRNNGDGTWKTIQPFAGV